MLLGVLAVLLYSFLGSFRVNKKVGAVFFFVFSVLQRSGSGGLRFM